MYNLFEVWPEDMQPSREYYLGTTNTREEAEKYKQQWEEKHPRRSNWDAYIIIREPKILNN